MRRTTLREKGEWIARRKAELGLAGNDYVPANSGTRQTASKKALLEKIEDGAKLTGIDWTRRK
ncbi:MAG: hypothetical protein ABI439_12925 [Rhodospirillales bacterium]